MLALLQGRLARVEEAARSGTRAKAAKKKRSVGGKASSGKASGDTSGGARSVASRGGRSAARKAA